MKNLLERLKMKADDFYGPKTSFSQKLHALKHRAPEETFDDSCVRYARTVADSESHFRKVLKYRRDMSMLPAGRQQLSVGRPFEATAFNCFCSSRIPDHTAGIFNALTEWALTMRAGGGEGGDFSTLRPKGELVRGLGPGAFASGPVSFMDVFNTMCKTIMSAGERRGAMMGMLRVDHPDILSFVNAKKDQVSLTNFNISVAITDEFMEALYADSLYQLRFGDVLFQKARATDIWAVIMENNWDYAEPGVIFIDRINQLNPLNYCETIYSTNPCSEQPLPPWGCCLLGSINLTKLLVPLHKPYLVPINGKITQQYSLDLELLDDIVETSVRAYDNVIDRTVYPFPQQEAEEKNKRRMGVGVTGVANTLEIMGYSYGTPEYLEKQDELLERILLRSYEVSIDISKEKGSFPLFDADKYLATPFIAKLPEPIRDGIKQYGIRNALLTSIAPTGSISLDADNVSSGIEPVFALEADRTIITLQGKETFRLKDYAHEFYGVKGITADQVTPQTAIDVLCRAQKWVDSSISKTCNVNGQISGKGPGVTFADFKQLYLQAWEGGAKSCSTFNLNGKRAGIINSVDSENKIEDGLACFIDATTGTRTCDS
jgi:ribonucleoside-diphosphate reductase alpha chain